MEKRFGSVMQAFATDIAVYIACPSCSQTGLVDQSTLTAARMGRAQVTLTCHACGERFDAADAQDVVLPLAPPDTLDLPLTARVPGEILSETNQAETEEPEPRYARASDHEPLTRYQSLHDVWQHLGAEGDVEDGAEEIVPTLPSWLQKKDNGQNEHATGEPGTSAGAIETGAGNQASEAPDASKANGNENSSAEAADDVTELASKLSKSSEANRVVDLTSIEQHLPALPEIGAVEADWDKPDDRRRPNWPLAIFGAMVLVIGLLAGALFF